MSLENMKASNLFFLIQYAFSYQLCAIAGNYWSNDNVVDCLISNSRLIPNIYMYMYARHPLLPKRTLPATFPVGSSFNRFIFSFMSTFFLLNIAISPDDKINPFMYMYLTSPFYLL